MFDRYIDIGLKNVETRNLFVETRNLFVETRNLFVETQCIASLQHFYLRFYFYLR
jgi:hypothetical protein